MGLGVGGGPAGSAPGLAGETVSVPAVLAVLAAVSAEGDATRGVAGLLADEDLGPAALAALEDQVFRTRSAAARLRRHDQELAALFSSARELVEHNDVDILLRRLVQRAHDLIGTDITYLTEIEASTGDLVIRAALGTVTPAFHDVRVPPGKGLATKVARTRSAYWSSPYMEDAELDHDAQVDAAVAAEAIVAMAGVPMLLGEEAVGVLVAAHRTPKSFTTEEISLLATFADHAAAVLRNARLLEVARVAAAQAEVACAELTSYTLAMEHAASLHTDLTAAVLRGGSVEEVAGILHQALRLDVVVVDRRGLPLASAGRRRGRRSPCRRPCWPASTPAAAPVDWCRCPASAPWSRSWPGSRCWGRCSSSTRRRPSIRCRSAPWSGARRSSRCSRSSSRRWPTPRSGCAAPYDRPAPSGQDRSPDDRGPDDRCHPTRPRGAVRAARGGPRPGRDPNPPPAGGAERAELGADHGAAGGLGPAGRRPRRRRRRPDRCGPGVLRRARPQGARVEGGNLELLSPDSGELVVPWAPIGKPLIGAVNGGAVTVGLELALHCDTLVASERARFADTHARVGVMPAWGMTVLLPKAVGSRLARQMSLTGDYLSASGALRAGLVTAVVARDELLPHVRRLGASIVGNDQAGVRTVLATYRRIERDLDAQAVRTETAASRAWLDRGFDPAAVEARRAAILRRGRVQTADSGSDPDGVS